jgi:hypothetical protein
MKDYKKVFMVLGYVVAFLGFTALFTNDWLVGLILFLVGGALGFNFTPIKDEKVKKYQLVKDFQKPKNAYVLFGAFLVLASVFCLFGKGGAQWQGIIIILLGVVLIFLNFEKADSKDFVE